MEHKKDLYEQRGVSSGKEEVHAAIKDLWKGLFPSAFCKIISDIAEDPEYCSIGHADGAGTKSALAYMYWKETGDIRVWYWIAIDCLVMNLDDLICAGVAKERMQYTLTIGRNKNLVSGEVIAAIINGTQQFIDLLGEYGVNIEFAGGESADVGDVVRTIIVDGTLNVRMRRESVIVPEIAEGDVVVAFSSTGQCVYEDRQNSGMGSNGLTSGRHDLFNAVMKEKYPETYDPLTDSSVVYSGPYSPTDTMVIEETGEEVTVGHFVLSPTRTYAPLMVIVRKRVAKEDLHAVIHCSGGGQTKVKNFLSPGLRVVKDNLFPLPQLFKMIQQQSGICNKDLYKTFNCGHRLEIYCSPSTAGTLISIAQQFNIKARIVGEVVSKKEGEGYLTIGKGEDAVTYYAE